MAPRDKKKLNVQTEDTLPNKTTNEDQDEVVQIPKAALSGLIEILKTLGATPYGESPADIPPELLKSVEDTPLRPILTEMTPFLSRLSSAESAFKSRMHSPIEGPTHKPFESLEARLNAMSETLREMAVVSIATFVYLQRAETDSTC